MRQLRSLYRADDGTSVVEMGLAAPLFASLLIGTVDLSNAYSTKLQIEQAAQRAVEKVMQRQVTVDDTTAFRTALQAEVQSAPGMSSSTVTVDVWLECNGTRQANYSSACPAGQVNRRYVTVAVARNFAPMFGTRFFPGANVDGTFTITTEAGVRVQ